jgi:hypothetical protein
LQQLVERNRGIILYPGWTSSGDYLKTPERFGTGPIQTYELTDAINAISLPNKVKLTREQAFIAEAVGVQLPFTPNFTMKTKLMAQMMSDGIDLNDDEKLALRWVRHVDGNNVSPKLPFHLRIERKNRITVSRIRDATRISKATTTKLYCINAGLTFNAIQHHDSNDINGENRSATDSEAGDSRDTDGSGNLDDIDNVVESDSVLDSPSLAAVGGVTIYGDGEVGMHNEEDGGGCDALGDPGLTGDGVDDNTYDSAMVLDGPSLEDEGIVDDGGITSDVGVEVATHNNAGGSDGALNGLNILADCGAGISRLTTAAFQSGTEITGASGTPHQVATHTLRHQFPILHEPVQQNTVWI